ncbi:MAG: hypothetical protein AAF235_01155 [Planctomycetota bacterium]
MTPLCPNCRYELVTGKGETCPECGVYVLTPRRPRPRVRVRDVAVIASPSLIFAAMGVAVGMPGSLSIPPLVFAACFGLVRLPVTGAIAVHGIAVYCVGVVAPLAFVLVGGPTNALESIATIAVMLLFLVSWIIGLFRFADIDTQRTEAAGSFAGPTT